MQKTQKRREDYLILINFGVKKFIVRNIKKKKKL
jgi:hypothetical protein